MKKKWIRQALILLLISILVFEPVPASVLRIGSVLSAAAEEKAEDSESEKKAEEDTGEEAGKKAEKEEPEQKAEEDTEEEVGKKTEEEESGKKTEEALTNVSDESAQEAAGDNKDTESSADGTEAPVVEEKDGNVATEAAAADTTEAAAADTTEAAAADTTETSAAEVTEAAAEDAEDTAAAETPAELETPVPMPAKTFRSNAAGMTITVIADKETFPEGTQMKTAYVSPGSVMGAIENAVDGEIIKVKAVDITFRYEDREIQPEKPVRVTISASGMDSSLDHEIVHIDDHRNNVVETVVDKEDMPGTKGTFEADGFSIYAVVETGETGEDARLAVNYERADGTKATQLINKRQIDQIGLYIYDPGVGTLPADTEFMGWSSQEDYSADTDRMTIADIREEVKKKLIEGVKEGDEVTYYAMVFKSYTVTYLDERNIRVKTAQILVRADDDSEVTHEVSLNYTPSPPKEEGAAAEFMGWQQIEPEVSGQTKLFQVGDTIDLEETHYILKASTRKGHWIFYEENLTNAPRTQPEFVLPGGKPTKPADPTRSGYTFEGWYTEDATDARDGQVSGELFDFSKELTSNTTVYGKWTQGGTADYSVMIWFQNKQGTGYDYSGITITVEDATVGSDTYEIKKIGGGNVGYARIYTSPTGYDYKNVDINGFHLSNDKGTSGQGYDSPVPVAAEGNTVVHVYFDRSTITYHFRYPDYATKSFSGLYQSDFTEWPDPGDGRVWTTHRYRFPLPLTVFDPDSVDPGSGSYEFTFTLTDYATNHMLYVYKMTETGEWKYTDDYLVATARIAGGSTGGCGGGGCGGSTWLPTEEYFGYVLDAYQKRGTSGTWTKADPSQGITINSDLYLRYSRKQYDIVYNDGIFVDGSGAQVEDAPAARTAFQTEKDIYYEADISNKGFKPTISGFTFLGWYDNEACAGNTYTFDKMPANNVNLYAKWGRNQYKIEFHPNDSTGDPIVYSDGTSHKDPSYADEGSRAGNPGGKRKYYELVGWYTDKGLKRPFDYNAIVINKTNISKYGKIYKAGEIDPALPTAVGSLDLYAKWRSKLIGAEGINVEYDANGGSDAPIDGNYYADQAAAEAKGASTPEDPKTFVFSHWEVQKWNGSSYEPSGVKVYPDETFEVIADDAKITDKDGNVVAKEDLTETNEYNYTVQLKAKYIEKDRGVRTHIWWFRNDGTAAFRKDEDLKNNQPVDVPDAPSRDGCDFVGWARVEIPGDDITAEQAGEWENNSSNWTQDLSAADLVTYENGKYSSSQVTADEEYPYHAIFAVWKEKDVTINYAVASDSEGMGTVSPESETVKALTGTASGSHATASDTYTIDYWTCDDGTDHVGGTAAFIPARNSKDIFEEHTYYAHFRLNNTDVTVHHYLKGTTTQVREDDTETCLIGADYTAAPAENYQGKALTADSCDPSQTITVSADDNEITIYYTLKLKITAKSDSKTYDGQPLAGEYIFEGALEDDQAAIEAALGEAPSITDAADEPFEYLTEDKQAEVTAAIPAYYDVEYEAGNFKITPREITVKAKDGKKVYDSKALKAEDIGYEITEGALAEGETAEVVLSGEQTLVGSSPAAVGTVTISKDGTDTTKNYKITKVDGTLTVTDETDPADVSTYEIRYKLNGGSYKGSTADIVENYPEGTVISVHEAPEREGYAFDYWKGSKYQPGDKYTVTGDHVLTAQWKKVEKKSSPDKDKKDKDTKKHNEEELPRTGDDSSVAMWIALLLLAAAGAAGTVICRKKKYSR